jgi:hypothetical protein
LEPTIDANFDLNGPNAADQPTPNVVEDEEAQLRIFCNTTIDLVMCRFDD